MYSVLPLIVYVLKEYNFSSIVLFLLYLLSFIPGCIFSAYMKLDYLPLWYLYNFFLFTLPMVVKIKYRLRNHFYMNNSNILGLGLLLSVFIIFIWLFYAHGRINLSLDDVYSIRMEARSYNMPRLISYIQASMKIIVPVFVVWALIQKKYLIVVVFSFVQILNYFIDGSKSTLFSLFLSFFAYILVRNHPKRILDIPKYISLFGIIAIIEFAFFNSFVITGLFIRRVMFVPNFLNIRYFDFFSNNTPDFYRGSLLKIIGVKSPYGSIARMIGAVYSGSDTLAANNGLFSDAYANLGWIGVIVLPFAIILLLKFIDVYAKDLNIELLIGAAVPFTIAMISASYFTLFLTHGVIAIVFVFYFLPRENGSQIKSLN